MLQLNPNGTLNKKMKHDRWNQKFWRIARLKNKQTNPTPCFFFAFSTQVPQSLYTLYVILPYKDVTIDFSFLKEAYNIIDGTYNF